MGHLDSLGHPSYANRNEITFYCDVAPMLPERLVPRRFETAEAVQPVWHVSVSAQAVR